ncbi:hypothetical protein ACRRTK_007363 [Alexandromys fortis]
MAASHLLSRLLRGDFGLIIPVFTKEQGDLRTVFRSLTRVQVTRAAQVAAGCPAYGPYGRNHLLGGGGPATGCTGRGSYVKEVAGILGSGLFTSCG